MTTEKQNGKIIIDWEKVENIIYGSSDTATVATYDQYGSIRDIHRETDPHLREHRLQERLIFFQETLGFVYNLQLKNSENYTKTTK